MASIKLENVGVEFPIFNSSGRSLTNSLVSAATGGRLTADKSGHVTIQALSNISLELKSGDRLGIVGHNGSGKSTLLRVLAGIYEPTSGRIHRSGSVASLIDIGLGISPENTGKENIYLRGQLMGMSGKEISKKFDEIVDFSELGDFIHLPVRTYSSGMHLRLAFAVATSITAEILIMDEWLSVGDADFSEKAERRLSGLVECAEILVIASHSRTLLSKVTNQSILLAAGMTEKHASSPQILEHYFGPSTSL